MKEYQNDQKIQERVQRRDEMRQQKNRKSKSVNIFDKYNLEEVVETTEYSLDKIQEATQENDITVDIDRDFDDMKEQMSEDMALLGALQFDEYGLLNV